MELTFQKQDSWTVVKVDGRIDAASSPELESAINTQLDDAVKQLAVDLSLVDYISSSGLRVLLATLKKLGKLDGKMALVHPHEFVMEVLDMSGFSSIFMIVENLGDLD